MSAHLCSWDAVGMSIVDVLAAWSRAPAVGARLVLLVGVLCSCSNLPGRSAVCFEGEGRRPVSRGLGGGLRGPVSRGEGSGYCEGEAGCHYVSRGGPRVAPNAVRMRRAPLCTRLGQRRHRGATARVVRWSARTTVST